jgi:hypothetical protein
VNVAVVVVVAVAVVAGAACWPRFVVAEWGGVLAVDCEVVGAELFGNEVTVDSGVEVAVEELVGVVVMVADAGGVSAVYKTCVYWQTGSSFCQQASHHCQETLLKPRTDQETLAVAAQPFPSGENAAFVDAISFPQ